MVFSKFKVFRNSKFIFGICFLWIAIMVIFYLHGYTTVLGTSFPKIHSSEPVRGSPRKDFQTMTGKPLAGNEIKVTSKPPADDVILLDIKDNKIKSTSKPLSVTNIQLPSADSKTVKQECIIPQLKFNDPLMMKHFKKLPKTQCNIEKDWTYVQNGTVRIDPEAIKKHKSITCDYYPSVRVDDMKTTFGPPVKNVPDGFNITTDGFKMVCTGAGGEKYDNVHHGVAFNADFVKRSKDPYKSGFEGLSIAILGFDSMSRMSWLRRLPETRKYFVEKLGAIELESHNIVGDGTTAVMLPMLTGKFEWELPECRRNFKGAKPMDNFPWLWHDFKKAGYLTSWSNAAPGSAPFNWRMLGFTKQPTDFYARTFYLEAKKRYMASNKWCLRSKTRGRLWLDYFRDIFHMYKEQRKFLYHFITDMSHDNNNLLTPMDDDIKTMIEQLYDGGYLNNTLFILMGDHGARYFEVRSTVPGKLEERLPYFSFLFPSWFEKKYPDAIKNLRINAKRLTTPFDLYYTFKDFLNYTGPGMGNVSNRAMSLFKEVPLSRSCKSSQIAPHWCACLAWKQVSATEPGAKEALRVALDTINGYTANYRSDCALLSIANVTMATKLETRPELLKFSNTDSNGGIYKIDFKAKNKSLQTLYQVTFYTTPGGGHFEITVTHDLVNKKYTINEKEISRINMYGNAPHCILDKNKQIRQYCYCKDLIKT